MKVFILQVLSEDYDWHPLSYHMTKEGATKAKYRHLNKEPNDDLYIDAVEVQE